MYFENNYVDIFNITIEIDNNNKFKNGLQFNEFKIPSTVRKIFILTSVTYIKLNTFCKCTSLEEILIKSPTIEIGYWSFSECKSLKIHLFNINPKRDN